MKVGIDCVETKRIKKLLKRKNLEKIFSASELENIFNCSHPTERASGYYAVKEAVVKALGIGLFNGLELNQICVEYNCNGAPQLIKTAQLIQAMHENNLQLAQISITHTKKQAIAVCIMQ